MKFEVKKLEDGKVSLQLGLSHGITFDADANPEEVVTGVNVLIESVAGISAFEMANAVAKELGLLDNEVADESAHG